MKAIECVDTETPFRDMAKAAAEVAKRYARSKWDEACLEQRGICIAINLHGGDITDAPKPEFK
jgi:hypothetical protein